MAQPTTAKVSAPSPFRKALGFTKGYNASFFLITSGAILSLVMPRFLYLDPEYLAAHESPQNMYWYGRPGITRYAFFFHLATVLPATVLAILQFIPKIRNKAMGFHRWSGRVAIILMLTSIVSVYIITPSSYGGSPIYQAGLYILGAIVALALTLSWLNIRRLQIDEHRAWMLRAWIWSGSVVTLRVVNYGLVKAFSTIMPHYHTVFDCDELRFISGASRNLTSSAFTGCIGALNPKRTFLAVATDPSTIIGMEATLRLTFPTSAWVAVALHLVGCELYLHLTSAEALRLRQYSYKMQATRGMANPGSAGFTSDRWGDGARFVPVAKN